MSEEFGVQLWYTFNVLVEPLEQAIEIEAR
jgi:hypothetical protein